jgi:chromosome segregation and condensation protein ScpB
MSLGLEQNYAQKRLQLAEDKSNCKIWTKSKYDEIVDLMTKETYKEDNTPAYYYSFKK